MYVLQVPLFSRIATLDYGASSSTRDTLACLSTRSTLARLHEFHVSDSR